MRPPYDPLDPESSGAFEPMLDAQGPLGLPARSLGVVALVLFVLFAAVVARTLWPIELLDPLW